MKPDYDYVKRLLEAFESSTNPTIYLLDLRKLAHGDNDDVFIFHMELLYDEGIVQRADREPLWGYDPSGGGQMSDVSLRLTSSGHQFLEALRNPDVWTKLKSELKDASVGTVTRVAKQLLEGFMKKKVESWLGQ